MARSVTVEDIAYLLGEDTDLQPIVILDLPGEPVSKARARFTKRGSKVHTYTPERTKVAEDRVRAAYLKAAKIERDEEAAFRVEADFYCGTRQRRDVDNMLKLILDGLNGVAWPDDVQVLEVSGRKQFVKKAEAHTVVVIYRIDGGMDRPTQPCIRCGTPFLTYESWRSDPGGKKYCTPACAYKHRYEKNARKCKHCETEFYARRSGQVFCSRECSNAFGKEEIPCAICDTKFVQFKSWIKQGRVHCSKECSAEHARRAARQRRTTKFWGTCLICGAGTTRKEYKRCAGCARAGKKIPEAAPQPANQPLPITTPCLHCHRDADERVEGLCRHCQRIEF